MKVLCPFCQKNLLCQNRLVNMKYRWGSINSYTYSCKECKRIYKSVNDNKKIMLENIVCTVISLMISCGISISLLDSYVHIILFFVIFSSVLIQLKFIIGSRMPHSLLEIDVNGVPIEEKGEYYVKVDAFIYKTKKEQTTRIYIDNGIMTSL